MRYWLGAVSKNHVIKGVAGSFCQLCHGREASQQLMRRGEHPSTIRRDRLPAADLDGSLVLLWCRQATTRPACQEQGDQNRGKNDGG